MFRHVAVFKWLEGTSEQEEKTLALELARLPSVVGELRDYKVGVDTGLAGENWDGGG